MAEIMLAKRHDIALDAGGKEVMRQMLFNSVDGLSERDQKGWRRFWNKIIKAEVGEIFTLEMFFPRNAKFHRRFFALLNFGFEHWEPTRKRKTYKGKPISKNFDQFREDVTVLAGYYEQTFDLRGRMRLKARSIKFASMDDAEFEELYSAVVDVLLARVLVQHKDRAELDDVVEKITGFF